MSMQFQSFLAGLAVRAGRAALAMQSQLHESDVSSKATARDSARPDTIQDGFSSANQSPPDSPTTASTARKQESLTTTAARTAG